MGATAFDWLSKITDIANFGKLLVDGGSGFFLSLGLLLAAAKTYDMVVLPIGPAMEKKLAAASKEVADAVEQLKLEETEKAKQETVVANLKEDLEENRAERTEARKTLTGVREGGRQRVQQATQRGDLARELKKLAGTQRNLDVARANLEYQQNLRDRFRSLIPATGYDLLMSSLSLLGMLGLVGYVVGTLLNPLYKFIFIDLLDRGLERLEPAVPPLTRGLMIAANVAAAKQVTGVRTR